MKADSYLNKIIEETGFSKTEIIELVEKKKIDLKGLITEEGALFLIAKELGVDLKEENREFLEDIELNIADINASMKNITLTGRIKQINRTFDFNKQDGTLGRVGSFILKDNTGEIKIVLWDEDTKILESEALVINDIVKIVNGYAKKGRLDVNEIHIGKMGKIIPSPEDVDYNKYPKIKNECIAIDKINLSYPNVSVEGKVIQKFPIRQFIKKDGENGEVGSIMLIDSSGSIRITFWNEDVEKLKDFELGDTIALTNLNPRKSNLDNKTIELFATNNTSLSKKHIEVQIKENVVDKIKDLQNQRNIVSFKGIITSIDNLKNITLKNGEEVALLNFMVSDESGVIRVAIWREKAEKLAEILNLGSGVLLKNVLIKLNNFSRRYEVSMIPESTLESIDLKIEAPKIAEDSKYTNETKNAFTGNYTKINEINGAGIFEIKGFIAKEINNITIYEACPKCLKKIDNCSCEEKSSELSIRMIINLIIDDESGTIRSTFIGDKAEKLLCQPTEIIAKLKETSDFENYLEKISLDLTGKDIVIRGKAKFSDFTKAYELIVYNFEEININEELKRTMKALEI